MREIKFRIWNKIDKTLQQGNWIRFLQNEKTLQLAPFEIDDIDPADCILMQYTGLKDKNGKEIYEGDILQNRNGVISEVKWDSEQSRWVSLSFGMTQKAIQRDKLFIIGNIYENQELIKK